MTGPDEALKFGNSDFKRTHRAQGQNCLVQHAHSWVIEHVTGKKAIKNCFTRLGFYP
jgi:hypothetical protein